MVKLGQYSRGVSIIGVGCSPFRLTLDDPDLVGITEGELFGYAALEAMQDAGLKSTDIDFYFHGQAAPGWQGDYMTPAIHMARWCGMLGKGSIHHSEACCTGYVALEQAVNAVASGKYDIVLTGACDMSDAVFSPGKPAHIRRRHTMEEFLMVIPQATDRAYSRPMDAAIIANDFWTALYASEYGVTDEQMDDALNALAINCRRGAARHPLALHRTEYADLAEENGFDDPMEYLRSPYNPKMSQHLRVSGMEAKCDGAAALIVCPTEMAGQFKNTPVEVLGIGMAALDAGKTTYLEKKGTAEVARQVYQLTGLAAQDVDLFYANDFFMSSHLMAAEEVGYLPRGEGWKYALDGRTAFDGDKPINTNGGRCHFGHAHGTSGLADHWEAVKQLRGACGDRQVEGDPKTALLRGFGGGQNLTATILRVN